MPDLLPILQSPYLWAAGALTLFLLGFLLGLAGGSHQERRRAKEDRERRREAAYSLAMGLSSVIAGNPDLAIRELRQVLEKDTEAVEIYILLGDLYRERGRVEQAIRIHKAVLKRPGLSAGRRTAALASLAKDFFKAGFLDRALRTFKEVSERDPESLVPLHYLAKLHEEEGAWEEALVTQQRLLSMRNDRDDQKTLGFLHWAVGRRFLENGQPRKALRAFSKAISVWPRTVPAHLGMGDAYLALGDESKAEASFLGIVEADPNRAWLALERLAPLWSSRDEEDKIEAFVEEHTRSNPHQWRLPLYLARRSLERGDVAETVPLIRRVLERHPRSMQAQGLAWRLAVPEESGSTSALQELRRHLEESDAFAEPQICLRCRYQTTELLWQCPHCRAWDPFLIS